MVLQNGNITLSPCPVVWRYSLKEVANVDAANFIEEQTDTMNIFHDMISYEPYLRTGFFLMILMAVGLFEIITPRRRVTISKKVRWLNNLILHVINSLTLRVIFPVLPIGIAALCTNEGWGLLNNFPTPDWISVLLGVVLLDLVIYLQHVMFHKVPLLWRLHKVHHMDLDIDVTTGLRFHPLEMILSVLIKIAAVILLGVPALAVLILEVLLNGMSMFNHGNMHIPAQADSIIRLFVVTPDMHRVHHSIIKKENNSNFGFNVPWWDRLFGTYIPQPAAGHEGMTIGLNEFRDAADTTLYRMLITPFMTINKNEGVK
jgi:sterol desaturase/sphingolipid hydroxylase (fatty acid hydroxylase superfamily)